MKNNLKFYFSIFLILLFLTINVAKSNELNFEAKNISSINDEIITATEDVIIKDEFGNEIFADKLIIDNKKRIHIISKNVILKNKINSLEIKTEKITFNQNKDTFFSEGPTKINKNDLYFIDGKDVLFDQKNSFITSENRTLIKDTSGNEMNLNKFNIFLNENYLIAHDAVVKDKELNIYKLSKLYYDFKSKKIYGKDVNINQDNKLISSKPLQSRSKSRSLILEDDNVFLSKTVYTNCKKRDGCPPWLIEAEEINHDKKNKIVNYKNAKLKFYDVPILYFPKFFHPDPTVKRQTGFLTPQFSSQSSNSYLSLPYFVAISESSDFTFSPRLYGNSKNLYQGEYRKLTKNSNHIFDLGIKNNDALIRNKNSSDTHFFYKSSIKPSFNSFENSQFNIKLQSVSDEKYLKSEDIRSPIIDSQSSLNSIIEFSGFRDDLELLLSAEVYEDLGKSTENDRYEYIFPNFNLSKNISTNLEGLLEFNSLGYNKIFNTNTNEKVLVNDLSYKSLNKINYLGLISNYEFTIKNFNANSENSLKYKNKVENDLQGLFQFNAKIPYKKEGEKFNSLLTPIFNAKFNPYQNKNFKDENRIIDYSNIYSINRLSSNEILEGGESITVGNEFKILDKLNSDEEIFGLKLATSFRAEENNDLPSSSYLGQKSSNIVGQSNLKLNEFVDLNYDFLSDNNIGDMNYHKIKSNFRINNFVTSFEFIEENNNIGKESFVSNETSYAIDDNKNLLFRTRKNKKTDLTEYYDLIYQYKMDCLTAGLEYRKTYYSDGTLEPKESIFFSVTILPFNNKINLPGIDK